MITETAFYEIKVVKNEREYKFSIPLGAPYGEAYDAAFEALKKVIEMSSKAVAEAQKQAPQNAQGE